MKLELIQNHPTHILNQYPLLFLHGAAGAAWNFSGYLNYLEQHQILAYAMSLRGHGLSEGDDVLEHAPMDDYVDDLVHVIKQLDEKPIVIGHSMGGAILQKSLADHQELMQAAVLLASANAKGIDPDSMLGFFYTSGTQFLRQIRIRFNEPTLGIDELLRRYVLSSRISIEAMRQLRMQLSKESKVIKKDLLKPYLPEDIELMIPVVVLGCTGDLIITKDKIEETAQRFQAKPFMIDGLSHFLMIDPEYERGIKALMTILEPYYR